MNRRHMATKIMAGMVLFWATGLTTKALAEGPEISGFINSTYLYNFNDPMSQTSQLRSYDAKANDFKLNAAHLSFSGELEEGIGYAIELDAGSDAAVNDPEASGDSDNFDVQEAYLTYHCPHTGTDLKFGKFVTLQGIEVIESPDNFNITRGYLYGLAEAFTHVGFLASHALPIQGWDIKAGIVNGWDLLSDNNDGKTVIGGLGFDYGDPLSGGLTFSHGPEQAASNGNNRTNADLTLFTKPMERLTLALQGNWGQEDQGAGLGTGFDTWSGVGVQALHECSEKFSVGARYEYMENEKGSRIGMADSAINNITISPTVKLTESITARAEYRYDWSNKMLFDDDTGAGTEKKQSTAGFEFIYSF